MDKETFTEVGKSPMAGKLKSKIKKKGYIRSYKQHKALMKKASDVLGINDRKGIVCLDLNSFRAVDIDIDIDREKLDVILAFVALNHKDVFVEYERITNKKRYKVIDRFKIINWLMYPSLVSKPLCLYTKSERRKNRKIVREIGLKKWGDVKQRPQRIEFDEEYIKEIHRHKKRTRFDKFDKLDKDVKIKWARNAYIILGSTDKYLVRNMLSDTVNIDGIRSGMMTEEEFIQFAMKYACDICGISKFRGRYAKPYWIIHRVNQYCDNMTKNESDIFMDLVMDHMGMQESVGDLSVLDRKQIVKKMVPTLKSMGLYEDYAEWYKEHKNCVTVDLLACRKIVDMLKNAKSTSLDAL